jgi:hypothetical protein
MSALMKESRLMKSRVLLVAPLALGMALAVPGPAQAASIGPVHAEVRVDNWVDHATVPNVWYNVVDGVVGQDVSCIRPEALRAGALAAVDLLYVIAGLSGLHVAPPSADR